MSILDRYIFRLFVGMFGIFALILVLIYWVNQAVKLFDQIIADGQSIWVFWELSLLSLPNVITFVIPNAAFVAVVFATNRLLNDSELVVIRAAGQSTWRLVGGFCYFAAFLIIIHSVLVHYLVPVSSSQLKIRQAEIAEHATARLIRSGEFISPSDTMTYFIGKTTEDGELKDVLLNIQTDEQSISTYFAKTAFLVPTETSPKLVLIDGNAQFFDLETLNIRELTFDSFSVEATKISGATTKTNLHLADRDSLNLWAMRHAPNNKTKTNQFQISKRILKTVSAVAAVALAFCMVATAKFNRLGVWLPFAYALVAVIVINAIEAKAVDYARDVGLALWPLTIPVLIAVLLCIFIVFRFDHAHLFKRRRPS